MDADQHRSFNYVFEILRLEYAFDLDSRPAKIYQEAEWKLCRIQIVNALGFVVIAKPIGGFELDQQDTFYQKVRKILADDNSIVNYLKRPLNLNE